MPSATVPDFVPSRNGFAFPNWFPPGTPVLEVPTPLGRIPIGDANGGVCGGMVFTAMDLHRYGIVPPPEATPPVFRYLCHRLIDSFNLPFGVLKYYDWMRRPGSSRSYGGVKMQAGLSYLTIENEWPRIRASLDAGQTVALGLVKAHSFHPKEMGKNHQVLAYAYETFEATGDITIHIYDPNYPLEDTATLITNIQNPDADRPVIHSREGPSVRGFFYTEYRPPADAPNFA